MQRLAAIATGSLILLASPAGAIERYSLDTMSCQQIKSALSRQSPAILQHMSKNVPGLVLYNTYYGDRESCPADQVPSGRTVQARDGACSVIQCVRLSRGSSNR